MALYHPDFFEQLKELAKCSFSQCDLPQIERLLHILGPYHNEEWVKETWDRLQARRNELANRDRKILSDKEAAWKIQKASSMLSRSEKLSTE